MKTKLYLIRHGQTDWNKKLLIQGRYDIPLNDDGRKQAIAAANRLKKYHIGFDRFLSSPLVRAYETCDIIKNELGYCQEKIIVRQNLIEREFGIADGIEISDAVYEKILNDDYSNIEKSYNIQERARKEVLEIAKLYPNQTVLIVTHSHFIKALFTVLDHNLTFKSVLSNGGINFIEIEDDKIINFVFNL